MPHSLEQFAMSLIKEKFANMRSESKGMTKRSVVAKGG